MARPKREGRKKLDRDLVDEEFIDDAEESEEPPVIDPYAVLGLETEATADDVKKAYRKAALRHHPDKAAESEKAAANKTFQEIAFAYAVLSDERRRKRYDLTGSTAEVLEDDEDFDWLNFYREQFEDIVTEENINRIRDQYKGSEEERRDLLRDYMKFKGRLDKLYETIVLSDILEDDDRFRQIINDAISKGEVESYPDYERENDDAQREKAKAAERKRREEFDKRHGKDAAENAKAKQKQKKGKKASNGTGDLGDLAALIQQRQRARMGGFFDNLEAKYAPKSSSRGKKRASEEPTEEEFQAAKERVSKRAKSGRAASKRKQVVEEEDEDEDPEEDDVEVSEADEDDAPRSKKRGKASKAKGRASARA